MNNINTNRARFNCPESSVSTVSSEPSSKVSPDPLKQRAAYRLKTHDSYDSEQEFYKFLDSAFPADSTSVSSDSHWTSSGRKAIGQRSSRRLEDQDSYVSEQDIHTLVDIYFPANHDTAQHVCADVDQLPKTHNKRNLSDSQSVAISNEERQKPDDQPTSVRKEKPVSDALDVNIYQQLNGLGFNNDQICKIASNKGGAQALEAVKANGPNLIACGLGKEQLFIIAKRTSAAGILDALSNWLKNNPTVRPNNDHSDMFELALKLAASTRITVKMFTCFVNNAIKLKEEGHTIKDIEAKARSVKRKPGLSSESQVCQAKARSVKRKPTLILNGNALRILAPGMPPSQDKRPIRARV